MVHVSTQYHMVTAHGNLGDHQFGAPPQNWPLIGKTLPYWLDETNNVRREDNYVEQFSSTAKWLKGQALIHPAHVSYLL